MSDANPVVTMQRTHAYNDDPAEIGRVQPPTGFGNVHTARPIGDATVVATNGLFLQGMFDRVADLGGTVTMHSLHVSELTLTTTVI